MQFYKVVFRRAQEACDSAYRDQQQQCYSLIPDGVAVQEVECSVHIFVRLRTAQVLTPTPQLLSI